MKLRWAYLISFVLLTNNLFAQFAAYNLHQRSYYPKVIRLVSAYTGYAEGLESINTNSAGLANLSSTSLLFSDGYSGPLFSENKSTQSLNLASPIGFYDIIIGASYNRLSASSQYKAKLVFDKLALHLAKKVSSNLDFGISFNYYTESDKWYITTSNSSSKEKVKMSSHAFDISAGLLYKSLDPFGINVPNKFGIGLFVENILGSDETIDDFPKAILGQEDEDPIFQQIRLGTSFEIKSHSMKINNLDFIKMLFVFDAVFNTKNYEFLTWQPLYGVEFTFLEILSLSYGRENEIKIDDNVYGNNLAYPVSRFGLGIILPLKKMFDLSQEITFELNYCNSDWQKIEKNFVGFNSLDKVGLSAAVYCQIF